MQSIAKPIQHRVLSPRVLSVDVLRGLTIALMILVNDPGDWSHAYSQLDHAEWNGFTLTDFVFPNFLFLVGASIIFSLESRIARGDSKRTLWLHMLRRAATLFAIKMFLSAFPHFHLTHLRLYGVLTRIALCYLAAGLICLIVWNTRHRARTLVAITAALLVGYWILMRFVPIPGFGVPTHAMPILDPDRNLAAWLDRAVNAFTQRYLHTGSLYNHTRDPEGLLSTIPALATTLIGCITGLLLRRVSVSQTNAVVPINSKEPSSRPERSAVEGPPHLVRAATTITPTRCLKTLLLAGLLSLALGLVWNIAFPINKNLWTSSYVLFSAGCSLLLLALFYWLIDIRRMNEKPAGKALLWPWLVFGSNAITAFVLSNFLVELMLWIKVPAGALINPAAPSTHISSWLWIYRHIFARHHSTELTSVAFAIAFTALCFLPNWLLWRRKIFLKI
jgi:predicted acyltransferase